MSYYIFIETWQKKKNLKEKSQQDLEVCESEVFIYLFRLYKRHDIYIFSKNVHVSIRFSFEHFKCLFILSFIH